MPTPITVKWYETSELKVFTSLDYHRSSTHPMVFMGMGRIRANLGTEHSTWKIKWNDDNVTVLFEHLDSTELEDPLSIELPVIRLDPRSSLRFSKVTHLTLKRQIITRVGYLIYFSEERKLIDPNGTLFIITEKGIHEAIDSNSPWKLIIGYSTIDPILGRNYTPMSNVPTLVLPKKFEVVYPPIPRVSRYSRSWVI